jgi:hypothetical protein
MTSDHDLDTLSHAALLAAAGAPRTNREFGQ